MLWRAGLILSILLLAGCSTAPRLTHAPSPAPYGINVPNAVSVDDGHGNPLRLQLASVVTNGGLGSAFGSRGYSMGGSGSRKHEGIDIIAANGAPVRAAAVGMIEEMGWHGDYGRFVLIRHSDQIETAYAHFSGFNKALTVGKWVSPDDIIGYVGTSGNATGPHLHYELRKGGKAIDPLNLPLAVAQQTPRPGS